MKKLLIVLVLLAAVGFAALYFSVDGIHLLVTNRDGDTLYYSGNDSSLHSIYSDTADYALTLQNQDTGELRAMFDTVDYSVISETAKTLNGQDTGALRAMFDTVDYAVASETAAYALSGAWPDTVPVAETALTLKGKADSAVVSDSTKAVDDSLLGTVADFTRHRGQAVFGVSPVVTGANAACGGGVSDTASGAYSVVCGGGSNKASGDSSAVVGGKRNKATGRSSFVGGGENNQAIGILSTVGGGSGHSVSYSYSTVGGGQSNGTYYATAATIAGGSNGWSPGDYSTIGGGRGNTASGNYATIPGGAFNVDSAPYSAALGDSIRVRATDSFAFVVGAGAGAGRLVTTGKRQVMIGVRQPNTVFWEDDSVVEQAYVKHISHGHAQFDSTVAICSTAVRSGKELFVKGDIEASGSIKAGGTILLEDSGMTFTGTAQYWQDLAVGGYAMRLGASAPTLASAGAAGGLRNYSFAAGALNEVEFTAQTQHGQNETMYVHLHWMPTTTGDTGHVVWGLEYSVAPIDSTMRAVDTLWQIAGADTGMVVDTFAWKHHMDDFDAAIICPDNSLSNIIICRLFRLGTHVDDTYAEPVQLLSVDFHVKFTRLGSRQEDGY